MQANIDNLKQYNNSRKMPTYRDKTEHYKTLVVTVDGKMKTVAKVSFKYPKDGAGRLSCIVWVTHPQHGYSWGAGIASGYGYCKRSAVVAAALRDTGVKLDSDIAGCGESAIESALLAVAASIYGQEFDNFGSNPNALFVG